MTPSYYKPNEFIDGILSGKIDASSDNYFNSYAEFETQVPEAIPFLQMEGDYRTTSDVREWAVYYRWYFCKNEIIRATMTGHEPHRYWIALVDSTEVSHQLRAKNYSFKWLIE